MIPLYGFLEGDSLGILVLAQEQDTVKDVIDRLQSAAAVRVAPRNDLCLIYNGQLQAPGTRIRTLALQPLDSFEVMGEETWDARS